VHVSLQERLRHGLLLTHLQISSLRLCRTIANGAEAAHATLMAGLAELRESRPDEESQPATSKSSGRMLTDDRAITKSALLSLISNGPGNDEQPGLLVQQVLESHDGHLSTKLAQFALLQHAFTGPQQSMPHWLHTGLNKSVQQFAKSGVTKDDLQHWIWILSPHSDDAKLGRLVESNDRTPLAVLLTILRQEADIKDDFLFGKLVKHIIKWHIQNAFDPSESAKSASLAKNAPGWHRKLSPKAVTRVLRLLIYHSLQTMPSMLDTVIGVAKSYIESVPANTTSGRSGFARQCTVLNNTVQILSEWSGIGPVRHSQKRWSAQQALVAFSTQLERQLIITKRSWEAMQLTTAGLEKSVRERKFALRAAKSWPPYRRELDGTDEGRPLEDNLSRSVLIGRLMQESGYSTTKYGHALTVLGGHGSGDSPTIQTRTAGPKVWHGNREVLNIYTQWAAQVKATRNAQEAWQMLQSPPQEGLKPNYQVYGEMFEKLFAKVADNNSPAQPGDSRVVFPAQNVNLTQYEISRLQPPDVRSMYEIMIKDGNRPVGKCLVLLILNAPSINDAIRYIRDSPWGELASGLAFDAGPSLAAVNTMPLYIINSYIVLLCRICSTFDPEVCIDDKDHYLARAITLVIWRFNRSSPGSHRHKAAWHAVLATLATPQIHSRNTTSRRVNDLHAVDQFMMVYHKAKAQTGLDLYMFEQLCRTTVKALKRYIRGPARTYQSAIIERLAQSEQRPAVSHMPGGWGGNAMPMEKELLSAWTVISQRLERLADADTTLDEWQNELQSDRIPQTIWRYMMALWFLQLPDEMVQAMECLFHLRSKGLILQPGKVTPEHRNAMRKLLDLFRSYVEPQLPEEQVQGMRANVDSLAQLVA
jgi:hypothetical protein